MSLVLITPPASEPIDVATAKEQLRVESGITADDDYITALIAVAREQAEQIMDRAIISQSWLRVLPEFSGDRLFLGMATATAISSIKYYDAANALQTVDSSWYFLDALSNERSGYAVLKSGYAWPSTYARDDAVQVEFVAGWANADAVPSPIKHWIKTRISTLYKHRDETIVGTIVSPLPLGPVDTLLDRYKVYAKG